MATTAFERTETGATLAGHYERVRAQTERLAAPLAAEDQVVQSMPDASPTKWHRAHTSWFFETFLLKPLVADYEPLDERYTYLFNSYYNAVGEPFARPHRGLVTRPTVADVTAYREHVDRHMMRLLEGRAPLAGDLDEGVVAIGINHEQQHQELIVTDLKHMLAQNPLAPVYRSAQGDEEREKGEGIGHRRSRAESAPPSPPPHPPVPESRWVEIPEGVYDVGHTGEAFCYDNETPRHKVYLNGAAIASRLVTAGEYLAFMRDRGYERAELWLADGWTAVQARGWRAPLYWVERDGVWHQFTLSGLRPVDPSEPVTHVSHFEADAYARWAGARLPTEFEWEVVAADRPVEGTFVESERFHPAPIPPEARGDGPHQLYGDVWQWTASAYLPYPGYQPPPGAIGEYNGKFMSGQMVLRGGSVATPADHTRATYRNFFYPDARWQFSGIRLARDGR